MEMSLLEKTLAKENAKLKERIALLEELAFKDPLTGLLNRRSFNDELNKLNALLRTERDKRNSTLKNIGIIMLDVDYFKKINDQFGHSFGDEVLQKIANAIKETVRKSDLTCRWGGEEFIIVMPNISQRRLISLGEKIRTAVEKLQYDTPKLHTSVSQGTAFTDKQVNLDLFINKADEALYEAKKSGRNRVIANWG